MPLVLPDPESEPEPSPELAVPDGAYVGVSVTGVPLISVVIGVNEAEVSIIVVGLPLIVVVTGHSVTLAATVVGVPFTVITTEALPPQAVSELDPEPPSVVAAS